MKFRLITLSIISLLTLTAKAQNGFIAILKGITPSKNFLDSRHKSVGIELGYGWERSNGRMGIDLTAYLDFLGYAHELPELRTFDGGTIHTGLSVSPRYCFNPESNLKLSAILSLKPGYYYGSGVVTQLNVETPDKQIENKTINAGFGFDIAPAVDLTFSHSKPGISIRLGYDSSNFGKGLNQLRSNYYPPIKYDSGSIFIGLILRFGRKLD